MKNYYTELNLHNFADIASIKKQYKKLANKYHPDKLAGNEDKFIQIREVYDFLVKNKDEYDLVLADHIYNTLHIIKITLEEAYSGCIKYVHGISVIIPPGITHGKMFIWDNIKVKVEFIKHSVFKIKDKDLLVDVTISVFEALLGTQVKITHLSGKDVTINIPECCSPGEIVSILGEGFAEDGILFVKVNFRMPSSLTKEDKEHIMDMLKNET